MKNKTWLITTFCTFLAAACLCAGLVIYVDPVFHYHAPNERFYYALFDERMMNDGVARNIEYDAIIAGTSIMEVARVTAFKEIYNAEAVKMTAAAGWYSEIFDNVRRGLETHPQVRYVVRGLDSQEHLLITPAEGLSDYVKDTFPHYLYNDTILDDYQYWFNKDIFFEHCVSQLRNALHGEPGGVQSFDFYYYDWVTDGRFVTDEDSLEKVLHYEDPASVQHLTQEEEEQIRENLRRNVTSLAADYPNVRFLYFFPPDCITAWGLRYEAGTIERTLEIEEVIAEELTRYENIHLFNFATMDSIYDRTKYCDEYHFDDTICTEVFRRMTDESERLRPDNYLENLRAQRDFLDAIDFGNLEF